MQNLEYWCSHGYRGCPSNALPAPTMGNKAIKLSAMFYLEKGWNTNRNSRIDYSKEKPNMYYLLDAALGDPLKKHLEKITELIQISAYLVVFFPFYLIWESG